ncbi:MAG TPA: helix-turn-helix domain-containing protein [Candidatus Thermoplasmatota archaeon]|nr:helix-turn-helix domain-containing protein [Candidatus Thermoplasmatota archaeon]
MIARSLKLPLGTALYHLDFLASSDVLVVRRDGRYKRFFVRHMLGRREKDYVSAFRHGVPRKVVTLLLSDGGRRTQRELAREVGVSRSTLSFHVGNLVGAGILTCEEAWPENHYGIAEPEIATKILVMFNESLGDDADDRWSRIVETLRQGAATVDDRAPRFAEADDAAWS